MEQESEFEGCQPSMQALELDSRVRAELNLGFQQIRSIEDQLRNAPKGFLGKTQGDDAHLMRTNILSASAAALGSFGKIVSLLSAYPSRNDSFSAFHRVPGAIAAAIGRGGGHDRSFGRGDSPISPPHACDKTTPPHSPRCLPSSAPACRRLIHPASSPAVSPCRTSLSGSGMSEDSPPNPALSPLSLDSDGEAAAIGRARQLATATEASTNADPELSEQRALARKRKFMPKQTFKQRASSTDPGNDGPPDDGYTWRKYGQKDILGSRNPRSYYRCTHKTEVGCPALKNVQRSDEEPSMFDVTYRGQHTCQSMRPHTAWPFPFSPEQIARVWARSQQQLPSAWEPILNLPTLTENQLNAPRAEDVMDGRSGAPLLEDGLPMGGASAPPMSTILEMSSSRSEVMAQERVELYKFNQSSLEMDVGNSVKPKNNRAGTSETAAAAFRCSPSRSPAPSHILFEPNASVLNVTMAIEGSKCIYSPDERPRIPTSMAESTNGGKNNPARTDVQPLSQHTLRSGTYNHERMEKTPGAQFPVANIGGWGQTMNVTNDFRSLQPPPDVQSPYRYSSCPTTSSDTINTTDPPGPPRIDLPERGHPFRTREWDPDAGEQSSSFHIGFIDSPTGGSMEYELLIGNSFSGCA